MFVELLAKASMASQVSLAHPSFVGVIGSLSPDEAVLLKGLKGTVHVPVMSLDAVSPKDQSSVTLADMIIVPPADLAYPDRVPLYLSNLIGFGLLEIRRDNWITALGIYDEVERYGRSKYVSQEKVIVGGEERPVTAKRHVLIVQPYGVAFIAACT
jgi:hypothetical protein